MGYATKANCEPLPRLWKNLQGRDITAEVYGDLGGTQWSGMDHVPEMPWDIEWNYQSVKGYPWRRARGVGCTGSVASDRRTGTGWHRIGCCCICPRPGLGIPIYRVDAQLDAYLAKAGQGHPDGHRQGHGRQVQTLHTSAAAYTGSVTGDRCVRRGHRRARLPAGQAADPRARNARRLPGVCGNEAALTRAITEGGMLE